MIADEASDLSMVMMFCVKYQYCIFLDVSTISIKEEKSNIQANRKEHIAAVK